MTSRSVAPLVGVQQPRVLSLPDGVVCSAGDEAIDLARLAGLELDPWQQLVLRHTLAERADGKWAAFEVGLVVPRQNGKGSYLEALELAGLFLLGDRMIIHSAHQFDTSLEAFRRLLQLIEESDEFSRRVKRISRSHGEEGIEMLSGQRIRFRTRTKGGGRGFSCDRLILDEAMILPETAHGALLPTLSARPNPQVIYTGSAVDQEVHEHGRVLARIRERGVAGDDPRLLYAEFSADATIDDADLVCDDDQAWAQANPGLGIRITSEIVETEQRSLDPRTFAVERLGIGDWPSLDAAEDQLISRGMWRACRDVESVSLDPVCLALDVTPDRAFACIAAAGRRSDGLLHVEIVEHRKGTKWIPERMAELVRDHRPSVVLADRVGPVAAVLPKLEAAGVQVETLDAREFTGACGAFFDLVEAEQVKHLGSRELEQAVTGASRRPLGDAWAWSRKKSQIDISPLVAATVALKGVEDERPSAYEEHGLIVV